MLLLCVSNGVIAFHTIACCMCLWSIEPLIVRCVVIEMPIVPFLLVASVLKQQGLTSAVSLWLSVPFLLLYWVMLWQIGLYLPVETSGEIDQIGRAHV